MTKHVRKICIDCGLIYFYQASGFGADENNNNMWCLECADKINKVRNSIVRKFGYRYIESNLYTLDELKAIETANEAPRPVVDLGNNDFIWWPMMRKVLVGLVDCENPLNVNIVREVDTPNGVFRYSCWTIQGDVNITRKTYIDFETNQPTDIQP